MDETDRPDDRRADGSWVLPNSESRRQRNHEVAKSGIQKRKKTNTYPRLSCTIEYLLTSNHSDRSIASEFFTGDGFENAKTKKPASPPASCFVDPPTCRPAKGPRLVRGLQRLFLLRDRALDR